MNQQCKVCGEPAAGFHFGAFTCEGCKSFFGRTYNNLSSISECKNGGICVINKKNRTACKACRLRKCIIVGMSKSGSRYGRRSNWFKIHCLLQEQPNLGQNHGVGGGHYGSGFLSGFLPALQPQSPQNLMYPKDGREPTSPNQKDLSLQTHYLHVAMMTRHEKKNDRHEKSPRPEDMGLQNQLKMLPWAKEDRLNQQAPTTPPRNTTPPSSFNYKEMATSPMFNFAQKDSAVPSSSLDVFRPFLPLYKRVAETPSDSGASSVDTDEPDDARSNSAFSYFKQEVSPTLVEREFSRRKVNATVTLTTDYLPQQSHNMIYPPPELVTPATSQHSLRGGDLLLASPSPGGLAVEQMEPMDLSVRSTKNGIRTNQPVVDKIELENNSNSQTINQEGTAKSNPLDLSVDIKRPAEVS